MDAEERSEWSSRSGGEEEEEEESGSATEAVSQSGEESGEECLNTGAVLDELGVARRRRRVREEALRKSGGWPSSEKRVGCPECALARVEVGLQRRSGRGRRGIWVWLVVACLALWGAWPRAGGDRCALRCDESRADAAVIDAVREVKSEMVYRTSSRPLAIRLVAEDAELLELVVEWIASVQSKRPIFVRGDWGQSRLSDVLLSQQGGRTEFPCFDEIVVVDLREGFDAGSRDWIESAIDDTNPLLHAGFGGEKVSTDNWLVVFKELSPSAAAAAQGCAQSWGSRFCQRIRKTVLVGGGSPRGAR